LVQGERAARRHRAAAALIAAAGALAAAAAGAQDVDVRPPFVTTPEEVVERMLVLAGAGPRDFVVDLGSGDGRIVIAAAAKFGARGLGVDIDESLVALARRNAERAGVSARAAFEARDALHADLTQATVVTIYLLPWLVDRLQPKLMDELRPGARIVAHAFPMRGWRPDRVERLRLARRHEGQGAESVLYLWVVPAKARGAWRAGERSLTIHQNFQEIEIEAALAGRALAVKEARLEGDAIAFAGPELSFRGRVASDAIAGTLTHEGRTEAVTFRRR
jgi:precorrin-6B methylase 2